MAMIKCPGCDASISEHASICPKCNLDVAKAIAEENAKEEIESLEKEANHLIREEKFGEAQQVLNKLSAISPSPENVSVKIAEIDRLSKKKELNDLIVSAKKTFAAHKFSQAATLSNKVLNIDPNNIECKKILEHSNKECKNAHKKLFKIAGYAVGGIVIAALVAIIIINQSKISRAEELMSNGDLNGARIQLYKCIPILAFRKSDLLNKVNSVEFERLIDQLNQEVSKYNIQKAADLSQQILNIAGGSNILKVKGLAGAITSGGEFKSSRNSAKGVDAYQYAGAQWMEGLQEGSKALKSFTGGDFVRAKQHWERGDAVLASAVKTAERNATTVRIEKRARDERQKQEQEEINKREEDRRRAESQKADRDEAKRYKDRVSSDAKNCYAYKEALWAERNDNYSSATRYYKLASKYVSRKDFSGKLGLASKWHLDGNWSNEHSFRGQNGGVVYLFVDHSDGRLDYTVKHPSGSESNISNEYSVDLRGGGNYKIVVTDKGTSRYSIHIEIYSGN